MAIHSANLRINSGKATALAIFDSGLSDLRLPLVKPPSSIVDPELQTQASQPPDVRRESVAYLAQRFFEWTATMEERKRRADLLSLWLLTTPACR